MAKNRRKFTQCPNCGYVFEQVNNYCPNCGQENHDLNVPVKHLVLEFLEGTLHYDTKFWITLKYLLFRPGLLTEKFNIGQRASYVPPFRLYVFVSLFFFFLTALATNSPVKVQTTDADGGKATAALPGITINAAAADSLALASDSVKLRQLAQLPAGSEAYNKLKTELEQDEVVATITEKFTKFTKNSEASKQKLLKNLSFMMFLLMPFFAWLLYLFYRHRKRNYVEHLMFSIHLHTFYFILLMVAMLIGLLLPTLDLGLMVYLVMALYLFLALHRVYKQSYWRTMLRFIPISLTYMLTLFIFLMGTVAISVLLS